ncbi:MAG: glycosyltransferase family 2 protein, partial [Candidatus Omnitrophica bacterium]|nr:glycosyltransferase family 2 protein [Candidatus Omnitrophota bacterium]
LVDGGSVDKTREIAQEFSAKILSEENAPAEVQRLKGLRHIRHDWFFLLDADERVSELLGRMIQETVSSKNSLPAYYVLRVNLYQGRPVHLHRPDYQLRLFRKDQIPALPDRIHRIPKITGPTGRLEGSLDHYFFTSLHDYFQKLNRYTELEASYWRREGRKVGGWNMPYYFLARPLGRFLQYYFLKKGCLDGFFGFFYCTASAYYEWVVASKTLFNTADDPSPRSEK